MEEQILSLEELLADPKYRGMSKKELEHVINNILEFADYLTLEPRDGYAQEKTERLYNEWHGARTPSTEQQPKEIVQEETKDYSIFLK